MSKFDEARLPCRQLLFDPNNYRYQDSADFVYADERRFHEPNVQEKAYQRLRREDSLIQLKNSFLTNGFIPVERLVVTPYKFNQDLYVVLEGNRRLAALRWILEDHEAGVSVSGDLLNLLEQIPVVIVENAHDRAFYESLLGVRHVSGIKEWGGYQRAKLVATLRDEYSLSSSEIAGRIGMKTQEVNRRYRAFKALQSMQEDDVFGAHVRPELYPIFHEAVSLPSVRHWLGWDEAQGEFSNDSVLEQFYQLITPEEAEDGYKEPKITSYQQVRELREILPNAEARRILVDPVRTFFDAVSVAKRDELSRSWATQVAEAITALSSISVNDLRKMSSEDRAQVAKLRDAATDILDTWEKLCA